VSQLRVHNPVNVNTRYTPPMNIYRVSSLSHVVFTFTVCTFQLPWRMHTAVLEMKECPTAVLAYTLLEEAEVRTTLEDWF